MGTDTLACAKRLRDRSRLRTNRARVLRFEVSVAQGATAGCLLPPLRYCAGMADAIQVALLKSLAACVMFLEQEGPDELDPDSALKALESVAYEISQLSEADQA